MHTLDNLIKTAQNLFLNENFMHEPQGLYAPIDYTLHLGGKRIRPVMLMAAHEMFGGNIEEVFHAAIGIEIFHNFTLLHDDLMDKSPLRRGNPTVHAKWSENTAILSGDTMFNMAWEYFLKHSHPQLHSILSAFARTAREVCEGQQYDMYFETRDDVSIEEYMSMIRLKTAVLLAGALKIGALYAQAPEGDMQHLYNFGISLGLAFQLQDDLLDAVGDSAVLGKPTGQDIRDNKKTFLILKALQMAPAPQRTVLRQLMRQTPQDKELTEQKVRAVRSIYDKINVYKSTTEEIALHFQRAYAELDAISVSEEQKQPLRELSSKLIGRRK